MITLTDTLIDELRQTAKERYPNEMCGVLTLDGAFIETKNTHPTPSECFRIDARDLYNLSNEHTVTAIVHSHPKTSAVPSDKDMLSMHTHDLPFVIVGEHGDVVTHYPKQAPLLRRPYVHGLYDCFSIVRDYYARELGIQINDYERSQHWYEDATHQDLYAENFKAEGFVVVPNGKNNLQRHDVLLCRLGNSHFINHALIYLGDDASLTSEETDEFVGKPAVLHHNEDELSKRSVLGQIRLSQCELVVRHNKLMEAQ